MDAKERGGKEAASKKLLFEMIAASSGEIAKEIEKAMVSGHEEGLNFKELAEKYTDEHFMEKVSTMGDYLLQVYKKLFLTAFAEIKKHHSPLLSVFSMIQQQTKDENASGKFLGSFVIPYAEKMVAKLYEENREILDNKALWS